MMMMVMMMIPHVISANHMVLPDNIGLLASALHAMTKNCTPLTDCLPVRTVFTCVS